MVKRKSYGKFLPLFIVILGLATSKNRGSYYYLRLCGDSRFSLRSPENDRTMKHFKCARRDSSCSVSSAVAYARQSLTSLRSLGCDFFAVVATASLAQKQPSPVVGKQHFEVVFLLRLTTFVRVPWIHQQKNTSRKERCFFIGAPGGTRTHNLLIRSQMLYPIKLRAH